MCSYHRYDGPIDQYPGQGDFGDGAATKWYFREVSSSQNPIKNYLQIKLLFLKNFLFGQMQIASLSSELESVKEPRRAGGGSPSSNSAAHSQLDEMPHM